MNPHQWSLAKQCSFKVVVKPKKVPSQAKAKRDGVIKPTKLLFQSILRGKILMFSKRYESTIVDHRTWQHVPSGTPLSTSSDNHHARHWNMKRDFYLDVYTNFKPDFINNMDHMRISGNEPSSMILSQTR